jgi:hypothetical protein
MMMNIFRKKRPRNEEMVWGFNEPMEKETPPSASSDPGPAAPQIQDDFLGALASAASSEQSPEPEQTVTNDPNLAEKLERLGKRMDFLFERLDLMERKMSRIERRNSDD